MRFRDELTIMPPKNSKTATGGDVSKAINTLGTIEETSGLSRGEGYDAAIGDAHLYLQPEFTDIEGYYVEYSGRLYRVLSVSIGKAALTNNRISHNEAELERVKKK